MSDQPINHVFMNVNGLDRRGRLRLVATKQLVEEIFPDGKLFMGDDVKDEDRPDLALFQTDNGRVYIHAEVPANLKVEVYDTNGKKVGNYAADSDELADLFPLNLTIADTDLRAREGTREDNIVENGRSYRTIPFKVDAILKAVKADARKTGFTFTKRDVSLAARQSNQVSQGADAGDDTAAKQTAANAKARALLSGRR